MGTSIEKARLYEQFRLPYPDQMLDDVLAQVGNPDAVADIGAGTGQLARLFAAHCRTVYAVEPDDAMRAVASEALTAYSNISVIDGSAEQTGLPDSSVDLIVVGNAYHRFQADAIAELMRILKPSAWVALIGYTYTDRAFTDMLFSKLADIQNLTAREKKTWHMLPIEILSGDNPIRTLRYAQSAYQTWEMFSGAARSGMEAPQPDDADFTRFLQINREVFDAFGVNSTIRIDYETTVSLGQPR